MSSAPLNPEKPHFFAAAPDAFDALLASWNWPKYRGQQIRDWAYKKLITDPAQMSNLSKLEREHLAANIDFFTAETTVHQSSSDGTQKLLLTWSNGANAETVMIPDADRRTACVSSQVGCPVGCKFCASGINGVKGNLTAGQIVEQIFALDKFLQSQNERIGNIVFMGMGEPLANYNNVISAIRILHDPKCFNIGARRITISTVGVPQKMRELAGEELPLNLAISLHAPNESLRQELIPWAEHFSLDEILDAARYYFDRTGREITLEYILLSGVNDRPQHARQLVTVCRSLRANVNLIRYNEVELLPYKRPKSQDVVEFQTILRDAGVNAHVRKSRGRDIDAACGQLRRREQQKKESLMQLRTSALLLIGILMLSFFSGCATLIRGNNQKMKFQTNPPQATVNIDGADHVSPVVIKLKRNTPHIVMVSAPGYQSITFNLRAQWDGATMGNIIMPGGSVGFGLDRLNGADLSFSTLAIITLNKVPQPTTTPLEMFEYKGQILDKAGYDKAMKEQREYHAGRVY
jgi:23S rRNA (adenine2503-C2)-methyltransferase